MDAVVTRPGANRAWVADVPEPSPTQTDEVLLQMLRVGVCGTDRHVMARQFGSHQLPAGDDFIVLGHEAVGRVVQTAAGVRRFKPGDLVVPTVRRGCQQCAACTANQADLCFTGAYKERGIVGLHGFLTSYVVEREAELIAVPDDLASVAPLVESLTTPEKALRRIANARAHLPGGRQSPSNALVTGSGPIALLAAMAFRLRGIDTTVVARQPPDSRAARIVAEIGAHYVPLRDVDLQAPQRRLGEFDAVIEATGAIEMAVPMIETLARNGVLDLVGGSTEDSAVPVHARIMGTLVGRNLTVLGSVNANDKDWQRAVEDLTSMRGRFGSSVDALITHHYTLADTAVAFDRQPGQIKAVIDIAADSAPLAGVERTG